MEKHKEKCCHVCGDKAIGFNFHGYTCASCRIFFQRYASKVKQLRCNGVNQCPLNSANRRCCNKCRMDKCLAIGMSINRAIFTKKEIAKRKANAKSDNLIATQLSQMSDTGMAPDSPINAIHLAVGAFFASPQPSELTTIAPLTTYELSYLLHISKASSHFVNENTLPVSRVERSYIKVVNLSGLYVKPLIKYCKHLEAYRQLSSDQQMMLFKPFFMDFIFVRMAFQMDAEKLQFKYILDETAQEAVQVNAAQFHGQINHEIIKYNMQIAVKIKQHLENDNILKDLFTALLLFRSRDECRENEFIRYNFVLISRLILRYLENRYQITDVANAKYIELMRAIKILNCRIDDPLEIFVNINEERFDEIIREIYDVPAQKAFN